MPHLSLHCCPSASAPRGIFSLVSLPPSAPVYSPSTPAPCTPSLRCRQPNPPFFPVTPFRVHSNPVQSLEVWLDLTMGGYVALCLYLQCFQLHFKYSESLCWGWMLDAVILYSDVNMISFKVCVKCFIIKTLIVCVIFLLLMSFFCFLFTLAQKVWDPDQPGLFYLFRVREGEEWMQKEGEHKGGWKQELLVKKRKRKCENGSQDMKERTRRGKKDEGKIGKESVIRSFVSQWRRENRVTRVGFRKED